jgi:hypothetical protein
MPKKKEPKMKIVVTIVCELGMDEIDQEGWPKCKTIHDVAKFEERAYKDRDVCIEDLISNLEVKSVKFEGVEGK